MPNCILSIELSTPLASIALWRDGAFVTEQSWTTDRDHSEIFTHLKETRDAVGKDTINLILVGSGPGSYGGVRVALAAADGFSLVDGSRIAAICSWEALLPPSSERFHVLANARRNGWVTGTIANGTLEGDLEIIPAADLPAWVEARANRNERILSTETKETVAPLNLIGIEAEAAPTASRLVDAWLSKTERQQESLFAVPPAPIYVRPPHITLPKTPPWFVNS